jgi:lysophospholipase L1-like esterase
MKKNWFAQQRMLFSLLMAFVLVLSIAPPSSAATITPTSMAALGDSITQAYNTGTQAFKVAPANSWSTGTTTSVNSLYLRFKVTQPAITAQNLSVSGAKMVDLNAQAAQVSGTIDYVTILIGANDVCTSSESTMTSVDTFRSQFTTAMDTLAAKAPGATIYVVSIPDVYKLWQLLKGSSSARSTWALFRICQSMLANPTSTKKTDASRRTRVRQRNIDFNTQLAQVCALYANCKFDGNAAFNYSFKTSDISTRDYFHPSLAGQATLATVAYNAAP